MCVLLDETVHPSRYRRFIFEDISSDVHVDEDRHHDEISEEHSKWLDGFGEEELSVGSRKSGGNLRRSSCVQINQVHATNHVGYWFEGGREDVDGTTALETYYIWSECDLKSEYNCKDKDYGSYAIPVDPEAHQFRIVSYLSWAHALDWVILEDCLVKSRVVALCLHSFRNTALKADHRARRLFVQWARRTSHSSTLISSPLKL